MPTLPPDEELIARCQAGDQEAYGFLVQRYQRLVFSAARRITGNAHDAEDVAQDTFVRAYFALDRFVSIRGGFPAWLVRIATNLSLTRLRRRREVPMEADERLPDALPGPAEEAEAEMTREEVRQAVGDLPDRYRTAILLRYVQDLSYDEIAAEMGIPRNTVATWLRRALDLLEKSLEAEDGRMTGTDRVTRSPGGRLIKMTAKVKMTAMGRGAR
ncbi:MAG TPA: sigma-70 family RNA polymerase sigma factor [Bacillota bacterium]|jgi:RNA polymerase sigma-70 factor (ECF subfamily)